MCLFQNWIQERKFKKNMKEIYISKNLELVESEIERKWILLNWSGLSRETGLKSSWPSLQHEEHHHAWSLYQEIWRKCGKHIRKSYSILACGVFSHGIKLSRDWGACGYLWQLQWCSSLRSFSRVWVNPAPRNSEGIWEGDT